MSSSAEKRRKTADSSAGEESSRLDAKTRDSHADGNAVNNEAKAGHEEVGSDS